MKKIILFFLLALVISLLFGFIASLFTNDENWLALFYSLGVSVAVAIFGGLKTIKLEKNLSSIPWLTTAFLLPFIYNTIKFILLYQRFPRQILLFPFAPFFILVLISAFFEEIAWRGYLFTQLKHFSWLKMNIVIGLFWAFWHYPVFITNYFMITPPQLITLFLYTVNILLLGLIFSWIRQKTGGLIGPTLIHAGENISLVILFATSTAVITLKEELISICLSLIVIILLKAWKKPPQLQLK